jgi:formylmethanofuran dehydrogenase subunit E
VLGVRIGLAAGEALDLDLPRADKRLLMLVETDGCFADGVSVATGCWLGRRTLRLVDYGRVGQRRWTSGQVERCVSRHIR